MRLDDVLQATDGIPFGGTDCALPMIWAMKNGVTADAFIIYTDSETWAGRHMHPAQALQAYRQEMGIAAKLVVVGMVWLQHRRPKRWRHVGCDWFRYSHTSVAGRFY
jgi:60 kDa SS-A/Ro ribonucleoprotein